MLLPLEEQNNKFLSDVQHAPLSRVFEKPHSETRLEQRTNQLRHHRECGGLNSEPPGQGW
jgi:hypothetical protein